MKKYRAGVEYWCVLLCATHAGFHTMTVFATPENDVTETVFVAKLREHLVSNVGIPIGTYMKTVYVSITEERA